LDGGKQVALVLSLVFVQLHNGFAEKTALREKYQAMLRKNNLFAPQQYCPNPGFPS
jgi:hypothetical protein